MYLKKHTFLQLLHKHHLFIHVHTYKKGAEMTFAITTAPKYKLAEAGRTFFQAVLRSKTGKEKCFCKIAQSLVAEKDYSSEREFPTIIIAIFTVYRVRDG